MKVFMFGSVINTCFSFMIKLRFVAGWREIVTVLSLYSSYVLGTISLLGSVGFYCVIIVVIIVVVVVVIVVVITTIIVLIDFHVLTLQRILSRRKLS